MSNLRTLSKFQSKMAGGGARPNLFEVQIPNLPAAATTSNPKADWGTDVQENFSLLCKAAQLPASTVASSIIERSELITFCDILPDQKDSLRTNFSPFIAVGTTTENNGEKPSLVINIGESSS